MEIIILFLLILLNGFFALSEIALVAAKKNRLEQRAMEGGKGAAAALELQEQPEFFLSSIQVGITLIGIVAGAYGGATLPDDVRPLFEQVAFLRPYAGEISVVLIVGLITYFSIVIGELIPKTVALSNPERVAVAVAPVIRLFSRLASPLVRVLSSSTYLAMRLFGIRERRDQTLTEEELRHLIKVAGRSGILERFESLLHQNIFIFSEQRARTLRTPRPEVEWVDINWSRERVADLLRKSSHSKFPVGDGSLDHIVGLIKVRDFFEHWQQPGFALHSILREPFFIPETMPANDILNHFRQRKEYVALVIDEFGQFEGLVTLHDLMEAIVGDLPDVGETEEPEVVLREDQSMLINGGIPIPQLNQQLNQPLIEEQPEHYTTLAGFILFYLKKVPHTGEHFDFGGYRIEIIDLDGRRIDKVLLRRTTKDQS